MLKREKITETSGANSEHKNIPKSNVSRPWTNESLKLSCQ